VTEPSRGKPRHLAAEFAAQFGDEEVAAAYRHRPPYPPEAFAIVDRLLGPPPRCVLELGAGTGDFTIGLAPCVDHLSAVESSPAMREHALGRAGNLAAQVEWLVMSAEDHAFDGRYSAVVAAEAFHWLDWYRVLPRIAASLAPEGHLILVERTLAGPPPWDAELRGLIRGYSTNRDYVAYDIVSELESRGSSPSWGELEPRPWRTASRSTATSSRSIRATGSPGRGYRPAAPRSSTTV